MYCEVYTSLFTWIWQWTIERGKQRVKRFTVMTLANSALYSVKKDRNGVPVRSGPKRTLEKKTKS